jgi:Flp pilus assembly protein TadB
MEEAQLEQLEFQTQHEATWQTLQAASGQRDLVVKLHGGLVALLTVAVPTVASHYSGDALARILLVYVAVGALALAAATQSFLRGVQSLRMLQFEMFSASRYSRHMLAAGQRRDTYFSDLLDRPRVPRLKDQQDPMGLIVQNVRHYLLVDVVVAPLAGIAALALALSTAPAIVLGVAGVVVAALTWTVVRRMADRTIKEHEDRTSERVEARYRALGVL